MTDCHDKNEQTVIFHTVDDAVVADAESQVASLCSLERLDPVWARVFGQQVDCRANSLAKITRQRLNGPQGRRNDRDGVSRRSQGSES